MANTFTPDFVEVWAREQQDLFFRRNVAMKVADMSFQSQMARGDTLNRPYRSVDRPQAYTRGTAITIDDKTDTQDQLTVNSEFATGLYVDDFDAIQSNYDLAGAYGRDNAVLLSNQVDADVLGEQTNANITIDDADIGGTAGNGISLTTSNVLSVFSAAKRELMKANADDANLFAVVSPDVEDVLVQYGAGRDTTMGDQGQMNGFFGRFYGFDLFRSNQLTGSAVLSLATEPTATDTVVIAGVTFTFVSSIGTTAGNVLLGGAVDTTRASLAGAINNPGTTSATQVALSTANQRLMESNFTATNDNAADTLTVVAKGIGSLVVSETLTDATDAWTAASQKQHNLFGAKGAVTMVMQKDPSPVVKEVPDKLGKNILNGVLYGVKTFNDGAKHLATVDIRSDGSSYTAPAIS